ncbi:hypothetical protein [Opitutus terrae]|uniref:Uncharacterized protein n=1 Tax=Opitutus terrae (strain DSM 11246 / JCM 15787 / PB90-1) TaxID=452637 RepID=B1ZTR8_OPITP|nr:hypothetical protein [Opitutus terrae]ACB74854.1 hypothetical protein Oter_1570 [Opitutus terrae PB90-1]
MNFKHAIGFMIIGAVFGLLPSLVPEWCPATGPDGSSTRALWLGLMSTVMISIALSYFGRRILGSLALLLEHGPAGAEEEAVPAFEVPAAEELAALVRVARQPGNGLAVAGAGIASPLPFSPTLVEPRRAA